jgi:hypothetical protein
MRSLRLGCRGPLYGNAWYENAITIYTYIYIYIGSKQGEETERRTCTAYIYRSQPDKAPSDSLTKAIYKYVCTANDMTYHCMQWKLRRNLYINMSDRGGAVGKAPGPPPLDPPPHTHTHRSEVLRLRLSLCNKAPPHTPTPTPTPTAPGSDLPAGTDTQHRMNRL